MRVLFAPFDVRCYIPGFNGESDKETSSTFSSSKQSRAVMNIIHSTLCVCK